MMKDTPFEASIPNKSNCPFDESIKKIINLEYVCIAKKNTLIFAYAELELYFSNVKSWKMAIFLQKNEKSLVQKLKAVSSVKP